ncbi:MAG: AAA family ATPase, partial [archaeon]|nr:AAA family ATPase [archaeon]
MVETETEIKKVVLERVLLKNFNSFQNDEVPLHKGFTIVTGPNGAGKSTVFQGIRFAMSSNERDGRSKRWSDFIRIGQNSGSVEIHIRKNDDKEPYKIRRFIFKDRAPYFQLMEPGDNKFRNTTVSKIQDLMKQLGYNPENAFAFVSQGNVTSIKNMETREIYDFLEIGLGLRDLRFEIQERKNEIQELKKQIKSLDSIKDSASYELDLLKPKLKRLQEKRIFVNEKTKLEKEKLWVNRAQLEREIKHLTTEIKNAD